MSFIKLLFLLLVIGLSGCSSQPDNRLPSCAPNNAGAILCLGSTIATAVNSNSSQKCSDMSGEQRKSCEAQVESLKKHISDASKK
jgi:hypothetical protein